MQSLSDRHILLVEDETLIALEFEDVLQEAGCKVVGPAATVEEALQLIGANSIDAALLDVNLNGEKVFPVADALRNGGIPFVLVTGHSDLALPSPYRLAPVLTKPPRPSSVLEALSMVLSKTAAA
jgi:DNA-binding response OmpR family regulator